MCLSAECTFWSQSSQSLSRWIISRYWLQSVSKLSRQVSQMAGCIRLMCSLTEPFLAIHCLQNLNPQCVMSSFAHSCRVVKATGGARRACLLPGLRRTGSSCIGPDVEGDAGVAGASCCVCVCVCFTLPVLMTGSVRGCRWCFARGRIRLPFRGVVHGYVLGLSQSTTPLVCTHG